MKYIDEVCEECGSDSLLQGKGNYYKCIDCGALTDAIDLTPPPPKTRARKKWRPDDE